ncbi:MAG: hypothetical protein AAGA56_19730, partial [Myxococcota bacterium]
MDDDLRDASREGSSQQTVDARYRRMLAGLPPALRLPAEQLPYRLGLVPAPEITWGSVFHHRITLEAPAVIFEGLLATPGLPTFTPVADAHLLAIVDAFATDRVMDGQLREGVELGELLEVLSRLREVRDRRLKEVDADAASAFHEADDRARDAMDRERHALSGRIPVGFDAYEAISFAKQAPAFPACLALARALDPAGHLPRRVHAVLRAIVLGLQFYDDVLDWEDDRERGGAWAVCLALHRLQASLEERADVQSARLTRDIRPLVLSSGTLHAMLLFAGQQFRIAATLAGSLGAVELHAWAAERAGYIEALAEKEKVSPGMAIRMHRLRHFRSEVIP